MAELLLDITRLLARGLKGRLPTGIDRVDLAYLQHYAPRARAVLQLRGVPLVLSPKESGRVFDRLTAFDSQALSKLLSVAVASLSAFDPVAFGSVYLNTGHSGLMDGRFARSLVRRGVRPVWLIHDLIPITHPEYCRTGEDTRHRRRMRTALTCASALLVNSRATLASLRAFASSEGLDMPAARVAPLAPGLAPRGDLPRPLDAPYFLVIATIEPRKNLALLLQGWRRLAQHLGASAPRLVIVGQRGWECENVVDLLERSEALRGLVIELPRCRDDELAGWLAHARALLFPSFVEGFGLPLVEALHFGTPVIASDLPVFREVAGDVPDYLDPLDGAAWLDRIARYAAPGSIERQAQLQRMDGYSAPTWRGHFAAVDELIEDLSRSVAPADTALRRA
jgi:glycosyltransferase involved in cell wall biosynthesis